MSGRPAVLQVVILRDGLLVGTEVFVPGTYTLGSADTADLRLDDLAVKPQHATLYFQSGRVAVQDANSAGVYVNGHKVNACEVRPVDEISCGPFVLKTRILAQQKPTGKAESSAEVAALFKAPSQPAAVKSPPASRPNPPVNAATVVSARQALASAPAIPPSPRNGTHRLAPAVARAETPLRRAEPAIISGQIVSEPVRARSSMPVERRMARKPVAHTAPRRPAAQQINVPRIQEDAKGAPRLYLELYWGTIRREAHSFAPDKKPVLAGDRDGAQVPLWGFALPEGDFVLAESEATGFRLYVPPSSEVEKKKGDRFCPIGVGEMESDAGRAFVALAKGSALRLTHGEMTLVAYVGTKPERIFVNPLRGAPWTLLFFLTALSTGLIYFLLFGPKPPELADFSGRSLPPVAIRLIAPAPKKPEVKKKIEEIKEPAPKKEEVAKEVVKEAKAPKKEKRVVREKPSRRTEHKAVAESPPPAENKALKALAKLSAAGPATGDILAAVDKLGSGPGSKNAKNNYKLSGLIGKAPIANAGLGTFGLGGGGRGGAGMLGAEILRGKGGGGIGAMGAGGVGRGAVGGTVTRASAHSVSVQGSIDREAVAKVVNAHLQEVRSCYERALLREPALAGKVVLEWTISQAGKVTTAKTKSSTLKSSAVEACILQSLKLWQFPLAKGGLVIVSYPFLFNSVGY